MKTISLIFKVHQPFRLRKYRFFDIGESHDYYDDYQNKYALKRFSETSYFQANDLMKKMLAAYPKDFLFSFVFSGTAMDQMQWYAPNLMEDFVKVGASKNVEFLAEPYSESLVSLFSKEMFMRQVKSHTKRIKEVFGKKTSVLANTDLIYSDEIGQWAAEMNFKGMLIEGAKHILGWKSPHYVYAHPKNELPLLLRDSVLSENISLRFSNQQWEQWPYTVDKLLHSVKDKEDGTHINIYINYAVLGEFQSENTGVFAFMEALIKTIAESEEFSFVNPSDLCKTSAVGALHVPVAISCVDEERDLTACYGNELQEDVVENWKKVLPFMNKSSDTELQKDFTYLLSSDHLHFMSTKWFSSQPSPRYIRPYDSPYDAYINYMNVLSDFMMRAGVYESERNVASKAVKAATKTAAKTATKPVAKPTAKSAAKPKSVAKSGQPKNKS